MDDKTGCEYCGGVTLDDDKGNCLACGGPRNEKNHYASMAMRQYHNPQPRIFATMYPSGYAVCALTNGYEVGWPAST